MLNKNHSFIFAIIYSLYVRSFVVYNHNTTTNKTNWWILWKGSVNLLCQQKRELVCEGVPIIVDHFFSLYTNKSMLFWNRSLWVLATWHRNTTGEKTFQSLQQWNLFSTSRSITTCGFFVYKYQLNFTNCLELLIFIHVAISHLLPKLQIQRE